MSWWFSPKRWCKSTHSGDFCGSYTFSLHKEGIDQGDLCDSCFWRRLASDLQSQQNKVDQAVGDFLLKTKEEMDIKRAFEERRVRQGIGF